NSGKADIGVAQDGEKRVENESDDSGAFSDAADKRNGNQEAEEGKTGNGLEDTRGAQGDGAQRGALYDEHSEWDANENGDDHGDEFALKLRARDGVERSEGFVHQENRWISGESAGDAYALTLAAGKFAWMAMREFARIEADKVKHFLNSHGDARGVPAFETGDETDIFRNGEMGKQSGLLNH